MSFFTHFWALAESKASSHGIGSGTMNHPPAFFRAYIVGSGLIRVKTSGTGAKNSHTRGLYPEMGQGGRDSQAGSQAGSD